MVRALCAELHALDGVSASVAIAVHDELVFSVARGPRCRGQGAPLRPTTGMRLGSITKVLTAALTVAVADRMKIDLDDPVGTTLPEFDDPLTLRALLTHGAGLRDVEAEPLLAAGDDWLQLVHDHRVPDREHAYANANYLVLGQWLERTTHTPFSKLFATDATIAPLRRRVELDPTALDDPGCGHREAVDGWQPVPLRGEPPLPAWTLAAGGGLASVQDLAVLPAALERTGLRPRLTRLTVPTRRDDETYGLGIRTLYTAAGRVLAHSGLTQTHAAELQWHPESGVAVAVMTSTPQPFKATLHAAFALGLEHAGEDSTVTPAHPNPSARPP